MSADTISVSRWPHRVAVALVCAVFPLIWVGGLVTTYEAGMAVPDWPNTYGYNLFLYPWTTWILGPWDLFIEHGHRLLGALAGMLTIALVAVAWRCDRRRWVLSLALVALAAVIVQGVLGGLRVLFDERQLAKIHGCFGPFYFALCVTLAAVTSKSWQTIPATGGVRQPRRWRLTAGITVMLVYVQLVLGAQLRHLTPGTPAEWFQAMLVFHLIVAGVLTFYAWRLSILGWSERRAAPLAARPAMWLGPLLVLQLLLGGGAWITNYGWPVWFAEQPWAAGYTVTAEGPVQAVVTTAHVALGSLILATSALAWLRAGRFIAPPIFDKRISGLGTPQSAPLVLLGAAWGIAR